ncbi:MAG: 16S rRNA (guanine(966)-N(2))-methyltransferase RsmD [Betaproteobacteria bacterium]|nr:16S rRNA (guanine(966)-N(2))-methyltransferase RsmD [Betaproteobacteria bacterium]
MAAAAGGGVVRIIGGAWRSRHIRFAARPGLRPTADRVRETLFNWLGQDLEGWHCLDLFAGSGALGFEAASRGAARVVLVEHDAAALRALEANRQALQAAAVTVQRGDALKFLRQCRERFDLVLLDPPFALDCWPQLLRDLPPCLKPGAMVYCESGAALQPVAGWTVVRQGRAGQVFYQLLQNTAETGAP